MPIETVHVGPEAFDPGTELREFSQAHAAAAEAGAIVSFSGHVRGHAETDSGTEPLTALTLEHYPGMTERLLIELAERAAARFDLLGVRIRHRVGRLLPGEAIVLVLTAAAHRAAAFDGAAFIMDTLKTDAPFWKQEERASGRNWVAPRETDADARRRWDPDER